MHKTPAQIARSLRAFRNAHRLGLLHGVRVEPGAESCEAARSLDGVEFIGSSVPRLPLVQCSRDCCACAYLPIGSELLHRLGATGSSGLPVWVRLTQPAVHETDDRQDQPR